VKVKKSVKSESPGEETRKIMDKKVSDVSVLVGRYPPSPFVSIFCTNMIYIFLVDCPREAINDGVNDGVFDRAEANCS
jgi:hypothetical protein